MAASSASCFKIDKSRDSCNRAIETQSRRIRRRRIKNSSTVILQRNLEMLEEEENESNLMSLSLNSNVNNDLGFLYGYRVEFHNFGDDGASCSSSGGGSSIQNHRTYDVCYLSAAIGVETPPFHCCKNDTSSGPIGPNEKLQPSGLTMNTFENRGKQRMD
ncbi:uncharacterized protein LOC130814153 [Amaranthus tricolor]|uniref:uncharacterized protein LOC130814153 n=1 Tax=Amaranthus tricolor TaxID=29722 RepID=UPI00258804CA|nr:uncharacterized protein LOC130814153 [Amaranthus tricolor]